MSNFAPPVTRDEFVYQDQLYIDVGNLNRHPRASISELTSLLRPDLANGKNKANETPKKDQVGHWYEAQCRHYGLPPTKDKNAAKVRLLNALNAGTLEVPARVKTIEADLKKEYAAANRKAKAEAAKAAKGGETVKEAAPSSSKKRKASDDVEAGSTSAPAPTKKAKATKSAADETPKLSKKAMKERAEKASKSSSSKGPTAEEVAKAMLELQKKEKAEKKKAAPKVKSKASDKDDTTPKAKKATPKSKAKADESDGTPKPAKPRSTQTTTNRSPNSEPQGRSAAPRDQPDPALRGMTARRSYWAGPAGRVQNTIESMPGRNEHDHGYDEHNYGYHRQDYGYDEQDYGYGAETTVEPDYMEVDQALTEITGIYDITCPTMDEWSGTPHYNTTQLRLYVCSSGSQTWASFDWGPWSGVMLMDPGPKVDTEVDVSFGWRTREHDTGEKRFGRGCTGEIDFNLTTGPIEVQGAFFGLYGQRVDFWGTRRPGPRNCGKTGDQFRFEWDEFVRETYGSRF